MKKEFQVKAPARICLFGDHQDYLGLPVIACAIDKYISLHAIENQSQIFNIKMPDIGEERQVNLKDDFQQIEKRDYFASAIRLLRKKGIKIENGFDVKITGNIPINAGLSSSSALCATWLVFLCKAFHVLDITRLELAQWIYQAEVTEHNEPGGNMDQFSITFGGTQFIQTRAPFDVQEIKKDIPGLVIANSGIKKETLEVLKKAKQKGQEAMQAARNKIAGFDPYKSTFQEIKQHLLFFDREEQNYLTAALQNHDISRAAMNELDEKQVDWKKVGDLMTQHHWILSKNLKVSPPEMDDMVLAAINAGAKGAKLVGSGGGGCVVAIAPKKEIEVMDAMLEVGAKEALQVSKSLGAFDLSLN